MGMRKYERAIIRSRCIQRDGNAKAFPEEWRKYHDAKVKARTVTEKDGKITVVRNKPTVKKQYHHDNGKVWLRQLRGMKAYIANLRAAKKKAAAEAAQASEIVE